MGMLLMSNGRLVAAMELKSQVGPSFGNNFNNRTEEAIGTAVDLRTAYREGAFGESPRPFIGWLMLVEDCAASRTPVRDKSPHFSVFRSSATRRMLIGTISFVGSLYRNSSIRRPPCFCRPVPRSIAESTPNFLS